MPQGGGRGIYGLMPARVVARDKKGMITVRMEVGTGGGGIMDIEYRRVAVDNPRRYGVIREGDLVLMAFMEGRISDPRVIGVFRTDEEYPLDHVDDDVETYPGGIKRKVSGEDGKMTLSREAEGGESTIEVEIENDVKITFKSSKKIQLHGENIEMGGPAAHALINDSARKIFNDHFHVETGTNTSTPKTMVNGVPTAVSLIKGLHTTKKVKAE